MKKMFALLCVFMVLGFAVNTMAQEGVKIQSGKYGAHSGVEGYTLDKNKGDRVYTKYINFDKGFDVVPKVIVSVAKLEANNDTNLRYDVTAEGVSRDGFTLRIKTWGDTRILNIGGDWLAFSN